MRTNGPRVDLEGCSRCGGSHKALKSIEFDRPVKIGRLAWTHWVLCPTAIDPVLVRWTREAPKRKKKPKPMSESEKRRHFGPSWRKKKGSRK